MSRTRCPRAKVDDNTSVLGPLGARWLSTHMGLSEVRTAAEGDCCPISLSACLAIETGRQISPQRMREIAADMHGRMGLKMFNGAKDATGMVTVDPMMWLDGPLDVDADREGAMSRRVEDLGEAKALELFAAYCAKLKQRKIWWSYLDALVLAFALGVVVVLVSRKLVSRKCRLRDGEDQTYYPTKDGECEQLILGSDDERKTFGFVSLGENFSTLYLAYDKKKKHFAPLFSLDELKKGIPDLTSSYDFALKCSVVLFTTRSARSST